MAAEKDNKLNIKTRQILGYFGALPFLFLSIFPLFLGFPEGYIFNLLLAFYGGVILSFLGGMTWGWEGEADNNTSLIFGIVVSLIGFLIIAASNMFLYFSLWVSLLTFIIFYLFELRVSNKMGDKKYRNLRKNLTIIVTISYITCLITYAW